MNKFARPVSFQQGARLVDGVLTKRDADFGILFERNSHLQVAKSALNIGPDDIDRYEDHEVVHVRLANGAIIAMTEAHGAAFAASAVEKFLRSGVSHLVRIGTCGVFDESIRPWDIVLSSTSIIDESTSMKYKEHKRGFAKTLLDELICPLGSLNHLYSKLPRPLRAVLRTCNRHPFAYWTATSDMVLDRKIHAALSAASADIDIDIHQATNFTSSARYRQDMDALARMMAEIQIKTIDMESSAIMSSAAFHGIAASILNVRIDNPMSDAAADADPSGLKTTFHGITDQQLYVEMLPSRIELCIAAILLVFAEISDAPGYPLLAQLANPPPSGEAGRNSSVLPQRRPVIQEPVVGSPESVVKTDTRLPAK